MDEPERRRAIGEHLRRDPFSNRLGARIEVLEPGFCRASLTVTDDMVNFHGTTHGGVIFTLADVALAAASNSRGQIAFALNFNISFLAPTRPGDRLIAEGREEQASGPTALYGLVVRREGEEQPIARAQAIAYRKKEWFVAP